MKPVLEREKQPQAQGPVRRDFLGWVRSRVALAPIGLALAVTAVSVPSIVMAAIERVEPVQMESHGGEMVFCKGSGSTPALLDYYHAQRPTYGAARVTTNLNNSEKWKTRDDVLNLIRSRLQGTAFKDQFEYALKKIGPLDNWISAPLKNRVAAKEPYVLPEGCEKFTMVARQGTTMFIDPIVAIQGSEGQLGLAMAREAMAYFGETRYGLRSFEKVRVLTRALLADEANETDIRDAIKELGGALDYYQIYRGATYESLTSGRKIVFVEAAVDHVRISSKLASGTQQVDTFACQDAGRVCWAGLDPEVMVMLSPADGGERIVVYHARTQSGDPDAPNAGEVYVRVKGAP